MKGSEPGIGSSLFGVFVVIAASIARVRPPRTGRQIVATPSESVITGKVAVFQFCGLPESHI
jgi:hypothetical protein